MPERVGRVVAGAFAVALMLAACGGGGGKDTKTLTQSASPTRTVKQHVVSAKGAKGALLTSKDIGSPLREVLYHRPTTPLFCQNSSAPTVFKESSASGLVGSRFTSKDPKADIIEEIYTYKSSADARAALDMVQSDMDCATGHTYNSDGTADVISIGASIDYATKFTTDFAFGWTLRTKDSRGIQIAIPVASTLMLFRYTAGNFADANKLPDAFELATTAFNRLSKA